MAQTRPKTSLQALNTFGVPATCDALAIFHSEEKLVGILSETSESPHFILGGGSNVLLVDHLPCTVLLNRIPGIRVVDDDGDQVVIRAGAGVIWNDLVDWAVDQQLGGIENLTLIPGNVGAAPMQNIGAYGVELSSVFVELQAVELASGKSKTFDATACEFGYRDSIFKRQLKDRFIITSLDLRLSRKPEIEAGYQSLLTYLERHGVKSPDIGDIRDAVQAIRRSKLPDPAVTGNAGSFFKNPLVSEDEFVRLQKTYPRIPHYPGSEGKVKLAAGWLIDQCGWKGKTEGNVGCHEHQALVIVNRGGATGTEILEFAAKVQQSVREKFGIELEREVNVISGELYTADK